MTIHCVTYYYTHSVLRLDATLKKRWMEKLFKFKKFTSDHSATFAGFGDDFDILGTSLEPIVGLYRMIEKRLEIDLTSWIR